MEFLGSTIWGTSRFIHKVDDSCTVYCELTRTSKEASVDFTVGLPGGTSTMSKEESKAYRLGIEGSVSAFTGFHADFVQVTFEDADFADFYSNDGKIIKKLVSHNNKYFMFDGNAYYEVISDSKLASLNSHESFISKDESHRFNLDDILSKKEKFAKLFLEMFESLR